MIADTTFVSDLLFGSQPALDFLSRHRAERILVTVITVGELAVAFDSNQQARAWLGRYRQLRLTPEVALTAASVERELLGSGGRLGENDNWIAGFCRYYGQPIVSRDRAFDRVPGLRRLNY